jgi:prolipoprotein diacylglyceryltransferase
LGQHLAKKRGINPDDIIILALIVIPFAIIGARLYYCIFSDTHYTFTTFWQIRNGGLAIYGGIIGGILAIILFCAFKKDFKLMFRNTSGSVSFIVLAVLSAIFSTFLAYLTGKLFESYGLANLNPSLAGNTESGIVAVVSYLYFPVVILFVTLFISIIFNSETKLFNKEKRTASVILTMPQTFKRQVLSKMFLNLILLFIVNLLVFILVSALSILPVLDALMLFIISLFITFSTFLMSVSHTLNVTKSLSATNDIATTGNTNFIFSIVFPIITFLLTGALLIGAYYGKLLSLVSPLIIYLIVAIIALILLVLAFIQFRIRLKKFSKFLSEGGISK